MVVKGRNTTLCIASRGKNGDPFDRHELESRSEWPFLADRTYGRAIGTVASVCRLSVTWCITAKRCILEQKLLLTAYRKSIGAKMNDLDLCLEVVSISRQPLRYIRRWISRKPLEIDAWFQFQRKWHMGYHIVTWPMTSRDLWGCCEAVRSAILATA